MTSNEVRTDVIVNTKQAEKDVKRLSGSFNKWLTKGKEGVVGFNGAALSSLFFGMELQRVFGGALKSIFEGYKKIIPENSEFNKQTTKLSANWEYFKFQLADTFAKSKIFDILINGAIGTIKWFQGLSDGTKTFIVNLLILLTVLGTFLKFSSLIRLGLAGISDELGLISAETGKFQWGALAKYKSLALVAAALGLMGVAMAKFYENSETGTQKLEKLKTAMGKVLNSALQPLLDSLGDFGLVLQTGGEAMVVLGAIGHNVLASIGMIVNAIIPLFISLFNIISAVVKAIWGAAQAWEAFKNLDLEGVKDAWSDLKSGVLTDINDISKAWETSQSNFNDLSASIITGQEITAAVEEYRSAIGNSGESGGTTQVTNNTTVVTMDQALSDNTFSEQELELLSQLGVTLG